MRPLKATRIPFARSRENDGLVRVAVAAEHRDAADVQAERRSEIGHRDIGRSVGIGGKEVDGLPHAAGSTGHVDRVSTGIGGINSNAADPARALPPDEHGRWSY